MSRISILGCGWLGLPLGEQLISHGFHVNGSTTTSNKLKIIERTGIKPYFIDLSPDFKGDISFFNCDILIINIPPRNSETDDQYHEKQLLSIRNQVISKKVSKVIFISSTAVYPNTNGVVCESDADESNLSRGGVPLLKMEKLFANEDAFETTVIRFGGLYGPDRHPGRFLAGKEGLKGADNPINMIHRDDCIAIIEQVIENNLWNDTVNAVAPSIQTRKEFYVNAAEELGMEAPSFGEEPQPFKSVSSSHLLEKLQYSFIH